ncbi:hypothetical protein F2Q69_00043935 [Brassica cretica]|uniref:Uncharacterized protein n=1 Tax=Brassica cretica TaxID=69181 RepID=A0A8S9NF36_BRACR|nr:hypothetical protein F2Q69_00043935 [Brassica cretica]
MVSRWWDPGIGDGDETGAESHQDEDRGEMEKRFLSNLRCLGGGDWTEVSREFKETWNRSGSDSDFHHH